MIKIDPGFALAVFFLILITVFIYFQYKISTFLCNSQQSFKHVCQCSYCSHVVQMDTVPDIWVCPVCKSYMDRDHA